MFNKEKTWRPLVYICSPYSGDAERNTANAIRDPEKEKIPEMDITEFTFLASGDPYSDVHGDSLDSANADTLVEETTEEITGQRKGGEWVGESRIRERLERPFNARSQDYKILLLQYLKTGKYSFDSKEVSGILGKNQNTVTAYLRKLMEEKIVTITRDRPGMTMPALLNILSNATRSKKIER